MIQYSADNLLNTKNLWLTTLWVRKLHYIIIIIIIYNIIIIAECWVSIRFNQGHSHWLYIQIHWG